MSAELIERLRHCSDNTRDEYLHEVTGRAADLITTQAAEIAELRAKLEARNDLPTIAYLAGSADAQDDVAEKIADWIESGKGPYHEGYAEPYAQAIRDGEWRRG